MQECEGVECLKVREELSRKVKGGDFNFNPLKAIASNTARYYVSCGCDAGVSIEQTGYDMCVGQGDDRLSIP